MDDNYRLVIALDRACGEEAGGRAENKMWQKRIVVHT